MRQGGNAQSCRGNSYSFQHITNKDKDKFKPLKLGRHAVFNEEQENILTEKATASTSSRNVIGPQPSTSVDITNYKPNDIINQENNKSDSEPLASVLSQLIPLPSIDKDQDLVTTASLTDEDIIDSVSKSKEEQNQDDQVDDSEPSPTVQQALDAAKVVEKILLFHEDGSTTSQDMHKILEKI
ncbi:unnamed protein product [Parnassius apollo]|uniref:(apollo) hypothetical protein n=1 Tax=Parnassius apollo TaxID=110799 RepID=A0A8S3XJY1_PARAO|nr:unnamed protein product [Parnassius apollo]